MLRDFWSVANDRGKVSANLLTDHDLEILDLGGPRIIAIHVPRASREFRPVHVSASDASGLVIVQPNRDSFGRMLSAQASSRDLMLITGDRQLLDYSPLQTLW